MLLQLSELEKQNEWIYASAEKYSYFLPAGFLASVVQSMENILQIKASVMNQHFIPPTNLQSQ